MVLMSPWQTTNFHNKQHMKFQTIFLACNFWQKTFSIFLELFGKQIRFDISRDSHEISSLISALNEEMHPRTCCLLQL